MTLPIVHASLRRVKGDHEIAVDHLIVPTLSILEVFRWILRERGESESLQAAALMQQGQGDGPKVA
jgi:hypothetical protein